MQVARQRAHAGNFDFIGTCMYAHEPRLRMGGWMPTYDFCEQEVYFVATFCPGTALGVGKVASDCTFRGNRGFQRCDRNGLRIYQKADR